MIARTTWSVTSPWRNSPAGEAFSSLEKVFALSGEAISSDGESVIFRHEIDGQRFYVKQYHRTKGLRSWVGKARIRLEAKNQLWFNQIGLPAAQVVAYGEQHLWGRTFCGALVTASLDNTEDLSRVAQQQPQWFQNRTWVNSLISQVAAIARTLHQHNFCHNDLKWRNILISQDTEKPQVYLIDCPLGQRWAPPLLNRRMVKDLACLDKLARTVLSRTARLRFFKQYREAAKLTPHDKAMIRQTLDYFR
ncbi:MAG: hypothetical protein OET90_08840 [Desulfuromonadales bacterium]|nr:hypothetical protein [Desulfuromonadales bacterium]